MDYKHIFYIILFLLVIYLIDKNIFSPRSLIVYLFFIILWTITHSNIIPIHNNTITNTLSKELHNKQLCQDTDFFSTITPDKTMSRMKSKPCCPQGYKYDNIKQKCKQFCRGCQTGTCNNGWCFSSCKNV